MAEDRISIAAQKCNCFEDFLMCVCELMNDRMNGYINIDCLGMYLKIKHICKIHVNIKKYLCVKM